MDTAAEKGSPFLSNPNRTDIPERRPMLATPTVSPEGAGNECWWVFICRISTEHLVQHDAEEHVCLHRPRRRRSQRAAAEWEGRQVPSTCLYWGPGAPIGGALLLMLPVRVAPVRPPHPRRGQRAEPPPIASVVERLHLSGRASLEGRRVAAPSMVVSFENAAPLPTTAPPPHPVCHMTQHRSPIRDPEDPPTCSPSSHPDSPAGTQSCFLLGSSAGVCRS